MNPWAMIIGGAVGGVASAVGIIRNNKSLIKAYKRQTEAMNKNYNYNLNQMTQQETQSYHQAVGDLFTLAWQGMQNNASVEASLAESGVEGRTQNQIKRTMEGTQQMQSRAIKENHFQNIANIKSAKSALYVNYRDALDNAQVQTNNSLTRGLDTLLTIQNGIDQGVQKGASWGTSGNDPMNNAKVSESTKSFYSNWNTSNTVDGSRWGLKVNTGSNYNL
jgi:hypothetical protein